MKPFSLAEIAGVTGATLAGPGDLVFRGVAPLADAGPEEMSFVAGPRNAAAARTSRAGALIVAAVDLAGGRPALVHPNPAAAFAAALAHLHPEARPEPGRAPTAVVSPEARVGAGASIGPGAVVERGAVLGERCHLEANAFVGAGAELGDDVRLGPGAVVAAACRVGNRCRIAAGAVIGADGFGYVWDGSAHRRIPQIGIVVLEDDVDVGANACIDRAALTETRIGRGTKIDNLVQIGHNVVVGEHAIICGQTGIAGSARIGSGATLAGQVGVADRMVVGDRAIVTAQAGVMREVEPGAVVSGMPAEPHADFLRREAAADRLPELFDRVRALEARTDKEE
ncbi:MAG TPA: UDP-3-O-(3-hydroxymyristoyl)glucosamine N-acyltransferase [Thermoanaerobaculia bacterium]|nr:UDP-3-O-(3-hydroxymyristoyl)glucosamine N-acyltransferase [Thermoanaerobaculia bacterium]